MNQRLKIGGGEADGSHLVIQSVNKHDVYW